MIKPQAPDVEREREREREREMLKHFLETNEYVYDFIFVSRSFGVHFPYVCGQDFLFLLPVYLLQP